MLKEELRLSNKPRLDAQRFISKKIIVTIIELSKFVSVVKF
jgi:hypothetical protein